MASVSLLIPCCASTVDNKAKVGFCSSALTHAATALILGIVVGFGAAYAAYFSFQTSLLLTCVVAGGSGCVGSLGAYIAQRIIYGLCAFKKTHKTTSEESSEIERSETETDEIQQPKNEIKETVHLEEAVNEDLRYWHPKSFFDEIKFSANMRPWHDIAQELSISIAARIEKNYGRNPSYLTLLYSSMHDPEHDALYKKECRLLLLTHQEILNLKLSEIAQFSLIERHALIERLMWMEVNKVETPLSATSQKISGGELSLAELRALQIEEIKRLGKSIPEACLGLMTAQQLEGMVDVGIPIPLLFPTALASERLNARQQLEPLPESLIFKYIDQFTCRQLCLLPNRYFGNPQFPWKKLTGTLSYLPLFSLEQLQDPHFPWNDFCKLEGIGEVLQKLCSRDLKLPLKYLPLNLLIGKKEEIKKLFKIDT